MNARQLRTINARKAATAPRPLNVGTVVTVMSETSLCPVYSRGVIVELAGAGERGPRYMVRLHNGRTGILHGSVMVSA